MSRPDPQGLAATVERLHQVVASLEDRVAGLEAQLVGVAGGVSGFASETTAPGGDHERDAGDDALRPALIRAVFLLGRSILVLAGAFLLRALTDGGTLPPVAGFGLGVAYALVLTYLADRAGGRDDRAGAVAFGFMAALVAYPFLLETVGISPIVPVGVGAAMLTVLTGAGLWVAARRRLRLMAWVFNLAALATILALSFSLNAPLLFVALLLALGVGTLLLAYTRDWRAMRWLPALAADALVLRLVMLVLEPGNPAPGQSPPSAGGVLAVALALLVVYLGIFTYRTLIMGKGARVFYVVQSTAVLLIGYGGAVRLAQAGTGGAALLGWLALAAAAAYYTVAFTVVRQRQGRGQGFFYFASLALVFLVLGARVVASGPLLAGGWIVMGLAAALLGGRFNRETLRAHSVVYLALAGVQTGLFAAAWDAFLGGAGAVWRVPGPLALVTVIVTGTSYGILVATRRDRALKRSRRVPRFGMALLGLAGLGAAVVWGLVRLAGPPPPAAAAASLAVIRTGVLAMTVVVLALAGRRTGWVELTWPVYPLLALGCGKLLFEDLRRGTPLTLTVGFALFGIALILAPRLLMARGKTSPDAGAA